MRVLTSTASPHEALTLIELGVDIIDIKNPVEGSLGAQPPWAVHEIAALAKAHNIPVSAALGDLPAKPGMAALAAFGLAQLDVQYVKAGLHGPRNRHEASELLHAVVRAVQSASRPIAVVAAAYADFRRFGGLDPIDLVAAAQETGCPFVMLDTFDKKHGDIFDAMTRAELGSFVRRARTTGLSVALAGSLRPCHLPELRRIGPDVIGVRGALCRECNRQNHIDPEIAKQFLDAARDLHALSPMM